MNIFKSEMPAHKTVIQSLAIIGFVSLVVAGIGLAVYSTRFVPTVVNNAGAAAIYLGSFFKPNPEPGLSVIPTASTTISFGESVSSDTTPAPSIPTEPKSVKTTAGTKTENTYQISGSTSGSALYGLSDLTVTINNVGYLTTTSSDSFVATSTIPADTRPAVSFTIKNVGTNASGAWRFSATIPTQSAYLYQSQLQQSLNPGDSIDYTLGFDQATRGINQMISVTANFDHAIGESNLDNNSASALVTILGS